MPNNVSCLDEWIQLYKHFTRTFDMLDKMFGYARNYNYLIPYIGTTKLSTNWLGKWYHDYKLELVDWIILSFFQGKSYFEMTEILSLFIDLLEKCNISNDLVIRNVVITSQRLLLGYTSFYEIYYCFNNYNTYIPTEIIQLLIKCLLV
jgi:hypothetical protein